MKRVFLSPPHLDGEEERLLHEAFASNWITTLGPQVDAFEHEMSEMVGAKHALALSSGTAALHVALVVLGVTKGDVVVCSDMTFAATANAICYCGAEPVFVDSDAETWNMDPKLLHDTLRKCSHRGKLPKAVIVVDLYGQTADYAQIVPICEKFGVPIVEDAAEALGATYGEQYAGTLGVIGVLSFNGNKIITTSGGGMLVSNSPAYISHARYLSAQAREPVPYYEHKAIGYNYRMSNLLAAVGRGQLQNLMKKVDKRREINAFYRAHLAGLPGIRFMPEIAGGRSTFWLTCLTIDALQFGATNEEVRLLLESNNIEARHLWKPMHLQPVFRDCSYRGNGVSDSLFETGLCLPSGSGMSQEDLERVVSVFKSASKG